MLKRMFSVPALVIALIELFCRLGRAGYAATNPGPPRRPSRPHHKELNKRVSSVVMQLRAL